MFHIIFWNIIYLKSWNIWKVLQIINFAWNRTERRKKGGRGIPVRFIIFNRRRGLSILKSRNSTTNFHTRVIIKRIHFVHWKLRHIFHIFKHETHSVSNLISLVYEGEKRKWASAKSRRRLIEAIRHGVTGGIGNNQSTQGEKVVLVPKIDLRATERKSALRRVVGPVAVHAP